MVYVYRCVLYLLLFYLVYQNPCYLYIVVLFICCCFIKFIKIYGIFISLYSSIFVVLSNLSKSMLYVYRCILYLLFYLVYQKPPYTYIVFFFFCWFLWFIKIHAVLMLLPSLFVVGLSRSSKATVYLYHTILYLLFILFKLSKSMVYLFCLHYHLPYFVHQNPLILTYDSSFLFGISERKYVKGKNEIWLPYDCI